MDENPYQSPQEYAIGSSRWRSLLLAAPLIVGGLLLVFLTPVLTEGPVGNAHWYCGWSLVGLGGWFIPNRLVAGIVIGMAIAYVSLPLLFWLM
jgi:hypothetical protein